MSRIFQKDYLPTNDDILRTRQSTTGIIETLFEVENNATFRFFDVGGQRGERKKWIRCFDDVRVILYIASLNEYDQMLAEDAMKNRMRESLNLFKGVIGLPWFNETSIVLFLNKDDLFRVKVMQVDLGIYFPDYLDGFNYEMALSFIEQMFLDCAITSPPPNNNNSSHHRSSDSDNHHYQKQDNNKNEEGQQLRSKKVYVHVTSATDTNSFRFVWKAVKHSILKSNLMKHGLIQ